MQEVVMKKDGLINILKENKAKHDSIFETSKEEYWITAKQVVNEKQKKLEVSIRDFQEQIDFQIKRLDKKIENKETIPNYLEIRQVAWDFTLPIQYPENHTKDYEKAIRMMEASIYDTVSLSAEEFDSYVLNNWEWKEKFIISNSYYLNNRKNRVGSFAPISGMALSKASFDAITTGGTNAF
jgi:hypothetical protein